MQSKVDGTWAFSQRSQFGTVRRMVVETRSGKGLFFISIFNFMLTIKNLEKETLTSARIKKWDRDIEQDRDGEYYEVSFF